MSKTETRMVETAERRAFVLALRKAGATYQEIAEATIKHFGTDKLPRNYDSRQAYQDVLRDLERLNRDRKESVDEIRRLETERCDRLLRGHWQKAISGDVAAGNFVLRVMERRARYEGLDYEHKAADEWRKEILKLVAEGKVTPEDVIAEMGKDVAADLFASAGIAAVLGVDAT